MEQLALIYIGYLAAVRLALIGVGAVLIFLGYRLFLRGIWSQPADGSEISATAQSIGLTIKNAAPGTAYALFGAVIVTTSMVASPPAATFEQILEQTAEQQDTKTSSISLRGAPESVEQADLALQRGDAEQAKALYARALEPAARAAHRLAALRLDDGELVAAQPLAAFAVALEPQNEGYQLTLEEIKRGLAEDRADEEMPAD